MCTYSQGEDLFYKFILDFTNELVSQHLIMTVTDLEKGTFPNDSELITQPKRTL